MSKKTGMNRDTFKNKSYKEKKASSSETVSLCSPKAKNTVEMFFTLYHLQHNSV